MKESEKTGSKDFESEVTERSCKVGVEVAGSSVLNRTYGEVALLTTTKLGHA